MPYARAGEFDVTVTVEPGFRVLRGRWKTAATGIASVSELLDIDGTLSRVIVRHSDAAFGGTISAYLYDPFDADVFGGLVVTLAASATTTKSIYEAISADRLRATAVTGPHALRVVLSSASSSYGEIEVYLLDRKLDPRDAVLLD